MRPHQGASYGPHVTANDPREEPLAASTPGRHESAEHYTITVGGHLSARWAAWFDGLDLTRTPDGTTVISGPVVDQSALHGLLQKLRDIGIPLIALTKTAPHTQPTPTTQTSDHERP